MQGLVGGLFTVERVSGGFLSVPLVSLLLISMFFAGRGGRGDVRVSCLLGVKTIVFGLLSVFGFFPALLLVWALGAICPPLASKESLYGKFFTLLSGHKQSVSVRTF